MAITTACEISTMDIFNPKGPHKNFPVYKTVWTLKELGFKDKLDLFNPWQCNSKHWKGDRRLLGWAVRIVRFI